jgi:hypothetical protein
VGKQKNRFHVHRHDAIEFRLVDLQHRAANVRRPRIVDQNIDCLKALDRCLDGRIHVPPP